MQTICACNPVLKGAWSTQGVIVFGTAQGMMKISEDGGPVTRLTSVDSAQGETTHLIPSLLPDQRHFTYYRDTKSRGASRGTYVGSIDAKPEQQSANHIFDGIAQYGSGRLLFVRAGVLMAQDFDVDRLSLKGEAIPITRLGQELAPRPEGQVLASGGVGSLAQLTWFDRQGKPLSTIGEPGFIFAPRISPDGSTVAFTRYDTGPGDIWLYEPKRGAYQFTFRMVTQNPIWSPDGSHIGFSADKIYQKSANGVGNEETLADRGLPGVPHDWSRDNKYFFFVDNNVKSKVDIWVLPLMGDKKPFPYLNADYNEDLPRLSPNGKWLAYEADKLNDRFEVYVDTFIGDASSVTSASRGSWKVSADGGTRPVWSRDGKELFFISADRKMMAVDVIGSAGTEFKFTAPKPLFDARISGSPWDGFDISNDGRFLMPIPVQQGFSVPITVIVNWTEGLKK